MVLTFLSSVFGNFVAAMIGFVIGQFLICTVTESCQRPKVLLDMLVRPVVLAPWFALASIAGAVLFVGSLQGAGLCVLAFYIFGFCSAIGGAIRSS